MSDQPTPETDAFDHQTFDSISDERWKLYEHARTLERQRDEARRESAGKTEAVDLIDRTYRKVQLERDDLRAELEAAQRSHAIAGQSMMEERDNALAELDAVKKERDALKRDLFAIEAKAERLFKDKERLVDASMDGLLELGKASSERDAALARVKELRDALESLLTTTKDVHESDGWNPAVVEDFPSWKLARAVLEITKEKT